MSSNPARQQMVITVTGPDQPGITALLTQIIASSKDDVALLDIEQVVIEGQLLLALLLEVNEGESASGKSVIKDLLFKSKEFGLNLDFQLVDGKVVRSFQSSRSFVVSVLSHGAKAEDLSVVTRIIADHQFNIDKISQLSEAALCSVELLVSPRGESNILKFKEKLLQTAADSLSVDVAVQPDDLFRRTKRLVVLDMDSTLIVQEVIDEMARAHGVYEKVSQITKQAMQGELDFEASLKRRVELLKGLELETCMKIIGDLKLTDGAELFVKVLKTLGFKVAVISGGFTLFLDEFKRRLNLDYAHANRLDIVDGKLTGSVHAPIVTPQRKVDLMEVIAQQENILLQQVIAVGDGANDIPMLTRAGTGIAFRAKPKVQEQASLSLNRRGLDGVLYLLGIRERDVKAILSGGSLS